MESKVPIFLPAYSVESLESERPDVVGNFVRVAANLHCEMEMPCTFFLRGRALEEHQEGFRRLRDECGELIDFQQSTYSGLPLKTVCQENNEGTKLFRGGSLEECRADIGRASGVIVRVLGVSPIGLAGPLGYYRGLSDRPDILQALHELGIRFTRTYTRNARDWSPLSFETQPFRYGEQGFPGMLEIPGQGWPDCVLKDALSDSGLDRFIRHIKKDLDYVVAKKLTWSFMQCDWACLFNDPQMSATRAILEHVRELGFKVQTHAAYYQEFYMAPE